MQKPVVSVRNVGKKYNRYPNLNTGLALKDVVRAVFGSPQKNKSADEFWALRNVNFDLHSGRSLGIIGTNGSGKTTLMRLIAGLMLADEGECQVQGNLQAMIALGAGFNKRLTGIENIKAAALMRGIPLSDISGLIDKIIDFSELHESIGSPVETYSSGMAARLGFSICVFMQPEVIIIDEALSVGDAAFRTKCLSRLEELKKQGVSMILVSHAMSHIRQFCDSAIWIEEGQVRMHADVKNVIQGYEKYIAGLLEKRRKRIEENLIQKQDVKAAKVQKETPYGPIITSGSVIDVYAEFYPVGQDVFTTHAKCKVKYSFRLKAEVSDLNVSLAFYREDGLHLTTISTLNGDVLSRYKDGSVSVEILIDDLNFIPGNYVLIMPIHDGRAYLNRELVTTFTVIPPKNMTWGVVDLNYKIERVSYNDEK